METSFGDRTAAATQIHTTGPQPTIDNPLLTFDDTVPRTDRKTELEEYVHQFASRAGLEDRLELLVFGARLARDKHDALGRYDSELTELEKSLIQGENDKKTGFWKQSKFFKATIITASLGGMIQGWTQSANNGTAYGMPQEFGLHITDNDARTPDLWAFGMLNAIPLLSAGLFGTTVADPLQENVLGRRGSIMLSCAITVASTIGASVTHNVGQLAACRAINGIALGAKASIVPIYSAEIAPQHIRGAILANWQLADAAGIFLGFLANLLVVVYMKDPFQSWRVLTNTVLIPTIPLLILIYLMPESPRYLMKHGEYRRALDAFIQVQTTPLLASRDLVYAHAQLDFENRLLKGDTGEQRELGERLGRDSRRNLQGASGVSVDHLRADDRLSISPGQSIQQPSERRGSDLSSLDIQLGIERLKNKANPYSYEIGATGYFKRLIQLWENRRCRRALLSASVAMAAQQATGVNTIAFLGTIIWRNSIVSETQGEANGTVNPTLDSILKDERQAAEIAAIIGLAFGAANYLAGLPAYWLSDKIGRSIMLALGLPNMAWSMLVFALLFQVPDGAPARIPLISVFAIIFVIFYSPTAGTSPFSISAEVFPLVSREAGMAVAVAVNLLGAGLLVLVFPFLMHSIGITGSLSIFAGLNVVAFVLVYLFVPETRMRTLEELQYTFDLPTKWHVEYRLGYIRRHFTANAGKYLTRKSWKDIKRPIPFYRWARITYGERSPQVDDGQSSDGEP